MSENPWIENTGTVPDGVGPDTLIEVEYRCGDECTWDECEAPRNNDPSLWSIENVSLDIIRWRFV